MKFPLVIFDWDGTVMDSAAKISKCMQLAALDCGLPAPEQKAVEHIIGISLGPAIAQLFKISDEKLINQLVERYKFNYLNMDTTPCPLFPGVMPLFSALQQQGTTLAVATGKARRGLNRAWEQTQTGAFFSFSCCADEAESKPSPDMLKQILANSGYSAEEAVMIGDTTYDMQMAESIGMARIGVNYGVHDESKLLQHKPLLVAESVAQLHQFLIH
ncbi:HAD family hydrolase [Alteromonas facilis]|uniref:HAD family hydrolase n=1 Tax=Alteromonas facilis TaxID=2048004 RepID=UPI000C28F105|nr:HAD-IA family hydrolase [Alteromonas facilis]